MGPISVAGITLGSLDYCLCLSLVEWVCYSSTVEFEVVRPKAVLKGRTVDGHSAGAWLNGVASTHCLVMLWSVESVCCGVTYSGTCVLRETERRRKESARTLLRRSSEPCTTDHVM